MRTRKRRFKGRIENGNQEESCKEGREEEKEVSEPKQRKRGRRKPPPKLFGCHPERRYRALPLIVESVILTPSDVEGEGSLFASNDSVTRCLFCKPVAIAQKSTPSGVR